MNFFPKSNNKVENINFSYLWFAYTLSMIGTWLTFIAFFIITYRLTGNREGIGIYLILKMLPLAIIPFIINHYFDYWKKRSVLIWCEIASGILSLAQVLSFIYSNITAFYMFTLFKSIALSFFEPTSNASIAQLFQDKKLLNKTYSLFSFSLYFSSTVAIALGGFLTELLGPSVVIFIDSITFFISALLITKYKDAPIEINKEKLKYSNIANKTFLDIKNSFNFFKKKWQLKRLFFSHLFRSLTDGGLNYFLPIIILIKFQKSPSIYGIIDLSLGIALIIGTILVGYLKIEDNKSFFKKIGFFLIVNGITLAISYSSNYFCIFWISLIISCFVSVFSIVLLRSTIMYYTKSSYSGRISSFYVSGKAFFYILGVLFIIVVDKYFNEIIVACILGIILILSSIPMFKKIINSKKDINLEQKKEVKQEV